MTAGALPPRGRPLATPSREGHRTMHALAGELDYLRAVVEHCSINACLHPLAALDGMLVTTVEGTGSVQAGCISAVQNSLATNNGTQCGYCSPGWVMNMTAAVAARGPKPGTRAQIEALFDGNPCRCTGYRPILYAFKRDFASDWDPRVDERDCMRCIVDPAEDLRVGV